MAGEFDEFMLNPPPGLEPLADLTAIPETYPPPPCSGPPGPEGCDQPAQHVTLSVLMDIGGGVVFHFYACPNHAAAVDAWANRPLAGLVSYAERYWGRRDGGVSIIEHRFRQRPGWEPPARPA